MSSFLKEREDYFIEHPPYSPDKVPCAFFLFPGLKKNLAGKNIPPAKSKMLQHLNSLEV